MNLTESQKKAANWLLFYSKNRPEGQIRSRIGSLLDSFNIQFEVDYKTPGSSGECDIYLPRRRTIIETKRVGLAEQPEQPQLRENNESPREQLERYLREEITYELQSLNLAGESKREWIGVVTDGKVWHVWRYPHKKNLIAAKVETHLRPRNEEELVALIEELVAGTPIGRKWIPSDVSDLFAPNLETLRELYASLEGQQRKHTKTKFKLWIDMLTTSSMVPDNNNARDRLFVSHSFLVALARGIVHVLKEPNKQPNIKVLDDGFAAWIIDSQKGKQWLKLLLNQIWEYEWRRRPGDVLRPLYEQIVGAQDRKAFGEFYTPDWLAEFMVEQVCDDKWCHESIRKATLAHRKNRNLRGVGILDPTCGSGTFLYHSARRLLEHSAMGAMSDVDKATIVCSLVHGIDVHPVAAEIARATLLRALPATPQHENASLRIYEGDALLVSSSDADYSLFKAEKGKIRIVTPGGTELLFPISFVERPEFADDLRRIVLHAIKKTGCPDDVIEGLKTSERESIVNCYEKLVEIIKKEGNSVWTWYIWNITGPFLLSKSKVNRIVANPPWVKMANIQAEGRKNELVKFAQQSDIALWSGGKYAPQFDIAQLFVKRCRELYLSRSKKDCAAWLVKKAAIKSGQWGKFREWHASVLSQTVDLEQLQPFGGGDARRSCVLFEQTVLADLREKNLMMRCVQRPLPTDNLEKAKQKFHIVPVPKEIDQAISEYIDERENPLFRNGATIFPKVLCVVNNVTEKSANYVHVKTVRSQHSPWSDIDIQDGEVPKSWLRPLITSKDMLPFAISPDTNDKAIVPVDHNGNLSSDKARECKFWNYLDDIYQEYCGKGKNTPKTLLGNLDYSSKLSKQLTSGSKELSTIVYPASGDVMRGCRLNSKGKIIGHSMFWLEIESSAEAAYLVAILNAPSLGQAFAQSREAGRHFVLHPWRKIPIKRFNQDNPDHVALAKLTERAEELVADWFADIKNISHNLGQVGYSTRIRKMLVEKGVFAAIDEIVHRILPSQAR